MLSLTPEFATPWSAMQANTDASELPNQFLLPEHRRPTVKHDDYDAEMEVPVIDMAGAMDVIIAQVREACLSWGMFEVVNHGVEEELLSRVQRQARRFFRLPHMDKMKVVKAPGKYAGYGHATVKEGDIRPWSEGFYCTDETKAAEFANKLWPDDNSTDFVDAYIHYTEKMKQLSEGLMQIVVAGLGVNPAHFEQYTTNTGGLLRWNYYPTCPQPLKTIGLTAHTDFNLLTVVHPGENGGLQIEKDGKWIAVRPHPGALAVNLGDTLQVLTNDKYKSVPHRSVVNATKSRISLVYFWVPLTPIDIVPSPDLVDEEKPCKYKPFNFDAMTEMKQMYFLNTLDHFRLKAEKPALGGDSHADQ